MTVTRASSGRHLVPRFLLLGIIGAVLVLGTVAMLRSVENMIVEDAQRTAKQWAKTFLSETELLDIVLAGGTLSPAQAKDLEEIASVGTVFRYKIFGPDGTLLLLSDAIGETGDGSLQDHQPERAARIMAGEVHTDVFKHTGDPNRPEVYAEAYVPVSRNGEIYGVVEVYVDESEQYLLHRQFLRQALGYLGLLALVGLGHIGYTAFLIDRQRRSDDRIHHLAHHDALTGLGNRTEFAEQMEEAVRRANAEDRDVALHMIDLDRFKSINDTLGHDTGDKLLQIVADRLRDLCKAGHAARLGGDEFAIVEVVDNGTEAEETAEQVVFAFRSIKSIDGVPAAVAGSVGTARLSQAASVQELFRCADAALYRAKTGGRDQSVMFVQGMEEDVRRHNLLRLRIRAAIQDDQFEIYYQPLHNAGSDDISAFEALVRLPDGEGGMISPALFIPVAEEMGLTHQIGRIVLEEACTAASKWPDSIRLSVNLSPQQFEGDVVSVVRQALEMSGLAPGRLDLEITENLFIDDQQGVETQLHALKALGVKIVMDDFGTGYSSLQHLWKFPFDKLKVDRSCFQSLGESDSVSEVLRTISAMGDAMQLRITAEGIETELQRSFAAAAGYHKLQGFLYSRPLPSAQVDAYIAGRHNGSIDLSPQENHRPLAEAGRPAANVIAHPALKGPAQGGPALMQDNRPGPNRARGG